MTAKKSTKPAEVDERPAGGPVTDEGGRPVTDEGGRIVVLDPSPEQDDPQ
jgi:hypothetical protein